MQPNFVAEFLPFSVLGTLFTAQNSAHKGERLRHTLGQNLQHGTLKTIICARNSRLRSYDDYSYIQILDHFAWSNTSLEACIYIFSMFLVAAVTN